eukprot:8865473-Ditylum_brightwellii.AAC.1
MWGPSCCGCSTLGDTRGSLLSGSTMLGGLSTLGSGVVSVVLMCAGIGGGEVAGGLEFVYPQLGDTVWQGMLVYARKNSTMSPILSACVEDRYTQ